MLAKKRLSPGNKKGSSLVLTLVICSVEVQMLLNVAADDDGK